MEGNNMLDYLEDPYDVIERPLWWHKRGLSQTASGYGRKLTSSKCVKLPDGRVRRIYVTQFSNAGSAWIVLNGKTVYLRA
jgi:hypothetical protein